MRRFPLSRRDCLKTGLITTGVSWGWIGGAVGQTNTEINWGVTPFPVHGDTILTVTIYEFPDIDVDSIYLDVQDNEAETSVLAQSVEQITRQRVDDSLDFEVELEIEPVEVDDEIAVRLYSDESTSSGDLIDEDVRTIPSARVETTIFVSEDAVDLELGESVQLNYELITEDGESEEIGSLGTSDTVEEIPEQYDSTPWTGDRPGTHLWAGAQPDEHNGQNSRLVATVDSQQSDPDNARQLTVRDPERVTDLELGEVQQEAFIIVEDDEAESSPGVTLARGFEEATEYPFILAGSGVATLGIAYGAYRHMSSQKTDESLNGGDHSASTGPDVEYSAEPTSAEESELLVESYSDIEIVEIVSKNDQCKIQKGQVNDKEVRVLSPPLDELETVSAELIETFQQKTKRWFNMDSHARLLTVFGSGTRPVPWVAVECSTDTTLRKKVDFLSTAEICNAIQQICEALHHVHRYGTNYTNLTTESVQYTTNGGIKLRGVLDQFEEPNEWYNAPEEFDGESTEKSTIYRIGLIAYELFTGTLPYKRNPEVAASEAIESSEIVPPSEQRTDIPESIESVLMRALSEHPGDRHDTVLHLRDDFESVMAD